jgi:hypothetical protein
MLECIRKILAGMIVVGVVLGVIGLFIFAICRAIQDMVIGVLGLLLAFAIFGGIGLACWLINDRD